MSSKVVFHFASEPSGGREIYDASLLSFLGRALVNSFNFPFRSSPAHFSSLFHASPRLTTITSSCPLRSGWQGDSHGKLYKVLSRHFVREISRETFNERAKSMLGVWKFSSVELKLGQHLVTSTTNLQLKFKRDVFRSLTFTAVCDSSKFYKIPIESSSTNTEHFVRQATASSVFIGKAEVEKLKAHKTPSRKHQEKSQQIPSETFRIPQNNPNN